MNIIVVALFNVKAWFSKRKKHFLHEAERHYYRLSKKEVRRTTT